MKQYLTEAELSEMVAVPRSTLRWRRFIGLGPAYVKIGRSVAILAAVQQFLASNMQTPALAALEEKHAR